MRRPSQPTVVLRFASLAVVTLLPLFALAGGTTMLPFLLMPAVMLAPALLVAGRGTEPEPPAQSGGGGDGGGGDGGSPVAPVTPTGGGGIPLPDSVPAAARVRGPDRSTLTPRPRRRPAHAPGDVPATPRVAPRR